MADIVYLKRNAQKFFKIDLIKSSVRDSSMITDRKIAFDIISRVLAITRLDIEQHQAINDLSLNIHGENYFRDIFNFVYDCEYTSANSLVSNEPYIDLVNTGKKKVVQITTTRKKEKILNSLKALTSKYGGYEISIFYLLDKASPNSDTIKEIEAQYPIDLKKILRDYTDLLKDINSLETHKIIELSKKYFANQEEKYTDEIVLDLVFKKLLKEKFNIFPSYDDDYGSIETTEKIILNGINQRTAANISGMLDYTCIIDTIDDGGLATDLRNLVIHELYKEILIEQLKSKERENFLRTKK